jgi:hypothetical protein
MVSKASKSQLERKHSRKLETGNANMDQIKRNKLGGSRVYGTGEGRFQKARKLRALNCTTLILAFPFPLRLKGFGRPF